MRYSLIALILILLLAGCTGNKYYTSKGISYFAQPAKELASCGKFDLQSLPETTDNSFVPGIPIVYDSVAYYPLQLNFKSGEKRLSNTAIYAYDLTNGIVQDSLMLTDTGKNMIFKNLTFINNIMAVGMKDTLMHIIKTATDLKILNEYTTGISLHFVAYAGRYTNLLRIVGVDWSGDVLMYDYDAETMQPVRKRLLAKNYFRYYQDKTDLWFFADNEDKLEAVKIDMSVYDPAPEYKTFSFAFVNQSRKGVYTAKGIGDVVYLSYPMQMEESLTTRLTAINFSDGAMQGRNIPGTLSYDINVVNGKTYIFRTDMVNKKDALIVSELNNDLLESGIPVTFFLSTRHKVGRMIAYREGMFLLTGNYYQLPAGMKKLAKNAVPDVSDFKLFLAVFNLD